VNAVVGTFTTDPGSNFAYRAIAVDPSDGELWITDPGEGFVYHVTVGNPQM
jgi:hypothetical protein